MRWTPATPLLFAWLAMMPHGAAATQHAATSQRLEQAASARQRPGSHQASDWQHCLQQAVADIHRHGAGGYSTTDTAHDALHLAFTWNERTGRLAFNPAGARPSFCSGAVYAALLSALIRWDAAQPSRRISPGAWRALAPARVPDGVGAWGWANADGPGFAMLVHELGAGFNFTDMQQARRGDVMKIWWNEAIGARERGHLVLFIRDEGECVQVWSSNQPTETAPGGFGLRSYPKRSIRRALFTRVTTPAAFNKAPAIGKKAWLMRLSERSVSWEECLRRCGIHH